MKKCNKCHETKDISLFNNMKKSKDGKQSQCKQCDRQRYYDDKPKALRHRKSRMKRVRADYFKKILEIKKANPCKDCGFNNPLVLQFDHISDDKFDNVTTMVRKGASWKRILEEIAKCEIVCANCHQIRTFKRNGWFERFQTGEVTY